MDEIYLKLETNSTRVVLIHYDPFSTSSGLMETGETVEQAKVRLSKTGVFVTSLPTPVYDASQYRAVLNYSGGRAYYTYVNIPSGDSVILNALENAIASIKTIVPSSKLLTVSADTPDKSTFDISEIFSANLNFGVAVCKNGTYLKNNIDFTVVRSGTAVNLTIFSGLTETDYAIVMAIDNLSEHTHPISSIINLQAELNNRAPLIHTHTISQITGLSGTLEDFSLVGHHHQLTDLDDALATSNKAGLVKISNSYTSTATDTASSLLALKNGLDSKAELVHTHNYLPLSGGTLTGDLYFRNTSNVGDGTTGGRFYLGTEVPTSKVMLTWDGYLNATKILNASYNDLAECFIPVDGLTYEECKYRIMEVTNDGKVKLASSYTYKTIGITSTDYGYLLGGTNIEIENNKKIPIGLAGTLWVDSVKNVDVTNIGLFIIPGDNGKALVATGADNTKYDGICVGKIVQVDTVNNRYKVILTLK